MRTITLSPAGHGPVRIASFMAVGNQLAHKRSYHFAEIGKLAVSNLKKCAPAICAVSAVTAFFAGVVCSAVESNSALAILAVSTAAFVIAMPNALKSVGHGK